MKALKKKDFLQFISGLSIKIESLSFKQLAKKILEYFLLLILLGVYYLAKSISRLGTMAFSYGIFRVCNKCVYGKGRETLGIISLSGYSRDYKVLVIMNHNNKKYARRGECIGILKCGKCLDTIDNKSKLPCKWKKI